MLTSEDQKLIEALKNLPLDYWDFKEEDTKEYTHGIHNYPAMMVCPISRNIIRIVKGIRPVNALLDPFAGSGTVLVEGMLSGIQTVAGNDINPLALFLEKAKTTRLDVDVLKKESVQLFDRISAEKTRLEHILAAADSYITDVKQLDISARKGWGDEAPRYLREFCKFNDVSLDVPDFKNIGYWFRPRVILELALIKAEIQKIKPQEIQNYCYVAFSEVIRFVSNRRNGEFKMFRMTAEKVKTFHPDVFEEFKRIANRNAAKMDAFCAALDAANLSPDVKIYSSDACTLEGIPDETFDLIVTSPPYGDSRTTVAYGEFSRLSLQWIDLFELSDKDIMGVDRTLMGGKKYRNGFVFSLDSPTLRVSLEKIIEADVERAGDVYSFYLDLDASIKSCAQKTSPGGYQFWVVGNRTVKNERLLTDVIIPELARQYGLLHIYTADRNIPNKVMPSKNSPTNISGVTNSTMTTEHIVVLKKQ